ncbi:MAG: DNA primase [Treponema sp. GWB1_62_6]|nr:MAG: DNA primase [Treponema sp. GWA1_62_8]OHE65068.1 MAG: DNA primase [Treponema sp. GWC1_61_84]OHE65181.1 MAG: DNA primase [Treponema sp. GWB1_62_6]OHE72445.1 MAG: DNA primase [Treponema sp. RIFOXYC1_FULL_61_9]HCM26054.1 DNA primase [Treponema sp.]
MNSISKATIQAANSTADALSVVGEFVRLEKKGGRYWGLCPFHNEKTPSFTVNPDQKRYYCFGCGKGGDLVDFLMEVEKFTFVEAVEHLARKAGIEIVYEGGGAQPADDGKAERNKQIAELYDRVAGSFRHVLLRTDQGAFALDYLKSRAVDAATAERFRLGYAPADRRWLHRFLSAKGYSAAFLAESGLFSRNYPESAFFSDRLMFPIADRRSRTVAFGARLLRGEGPKYLNSSESELFRKGENLFALDLANQEIRRLKTAIVCEGYMDVIALHQSGVVNAVAPLGTAFTEGQAAILRRGAERVLMAFDSDEAGRNAAVKGILTCRKLGLACGIVEIKGGKDPADILKDAGAEALQNAMKYFINDFDYLVDRARALYDITDSEGKAKAVAFMFPYLETLDSAVSRDACAGALSDAFGVDRAAVANDYAGRSEPRRETRAGAAVLTGTAVRMNDELFLMLAVMANRDLYRKLRSSLSPEDLDDQRAKELFIVLEECFRTDSIDFDGLAARIGDESLKAFVLEKGASDEFSVNPERLVSDGIARIKRRILERRRSELLIRMRMAKNGGKDAENLIDELLSETMHIDEELARLKDVHE